MTRFPDNFLWGAATSAFQIEGSPLADGAGPSNWYRFTHEPGRVTDDETADTACDHYRLWRSDVALMRQLGLQAYRFSISWSRILPAGTGKVNPAGLAFYDRLVDALLAAGIRPAPTLYHWDLPAALEDRGGWCNRDCADWFGEYAGIIFEALGDRVDLWFTHNEPWVVVDAGHVQGQHPPGLRDLRAAALAAHNLLRGHGIAVQRLRATGKGQIGIVVNQEPKDTASDDPDDRRATRLADAYMNRQFLDPVLLGSYPGDLAEIYGDRWDDFPAGDMEVISTPIDFVGLNYYTRSVNRYDPDPATAPFHVAQVRQPGALYTTMDWEVRPASLTAMLLTIRKRYGNIPLYITENGAAFRDPEPDTHGRVADTDRCDYFRGHLSALAAAMDAGVDVRGYFAWSLLDNFEWTFGYAKTFGLVAVDSATGARFPKDSARFYRNVIRSRGAGI